MLSLPNLTALAGFMSLVGAKPVGDVVPSPHGSKNVRTYSLAPSHSNANATSHTTGAKNATIIGSSTHHHYHHHKNTTVSSSSHSHSHSHHHYNTTDKNDAIVNWASLRCPPNQGDVDDNVLDISGVLPTPTYGAEERVWMVCTETLIRAPPRRVYDALLDFARYREWNSFVTDVQMHPSNVTTPHGVREGMDMTFTCQGLGGEGVVTTSPEKVTILTHANTNASSFSASSPAVFSKPSSSKDCEHDDPTTTKTTTKRGENGHGGSGYLLNAWRSDLKVGGELIRAEHPNVLTDAGDGMTRYVSWETYYAGASTAVVLLLKPQMQALFEQQAADLKAYLEKE